MRLSILWISVARCLFHVLAARRFSGQSGVLTVFCRRALYGRMAFHSFIHRGGLRPPHKKGGRRPSPFWGSYFYI